MTTTGTIATLYRTLSASNYYTLSGVDQYWEVGRQLLQPEYSLYIVSFIRRGVDEDRRFVEDLYRCIHGCGFGKSTITLDGQKHLLSHLYCIPSSLPRSYKELDPEVKSILDLLDRIPGLQLSFSFLPGHMLDCDLIVATFTVGPTCSPNDAITEKYQGRVWRFLVSWNKPNIEILKHTDFLKAQDEEIDELLKSELLKSELLKSELLKSEPNHKEDLNQKDNDKREPEAGGWVHSLLKSVGCV